MRALASVLALLLLAPLAPVEAQHAPAPGLLGPNRLQPIVVAGDAGFLAPPDVSGVRSGHGTPLDPYVIAGWRMAGLPTNPTVGDTGYANAWLPCILLQNTRASVVIRDNVIRGNNCHGIWLQNVSNVVVEANVVTHNTGHGVLVESFGPPSQGRFGCTVVVRNNVLKANGFDGVRAFHAREVLIEGNEVVANANFGVLARATPGVVVRGNVADHNDVAGIAVEMANGALVERNVARWNPTGLDVEFSDDVVVQDNVAQDNRDLGIYTSEMSGRTLVQRNLVERNGLRQQAGWNDGIALNGVDEVARGNVVRGNADGIALGGTASGSVVERNLLQGNARGLRLEACPARVEANGVHGNGLGLSAAAAGCGGVARNNVQGNGVGARAEEGASLAAEQNWWGASSGPSGPSYSGSGDRVEGGVDASPWLAARVPDAPPA